jgi:hypothetical protein
MKKKSFLASAAVAAALIAAVGTTAASHDDDHGGGRSRRLRADLKGFGEVPAVSTAARGAFRAVLSEDETEIAYRLDYAGLQGEVRQAHIHVGDHHTNGGISVWLCQTATNPAPVVSTPVCGAPGGDGPEAEGTLTAASVVGPVGQLVAAGEFAELVRAIKAGVTYVNVHTAAVPSGEIRGQIRPY